MAPQIARGAAQAPSGKEKVLLGDIEVAFRHAGTGPAVVFVHGLAEDGRSWDEIIARLPPGLAAFVPDLRGHGGTTAGEGVGTTAQLASDLTAFLDAITGPAICVGFSLGGVIVLAAALQRPDLVRKAVVIGTSSKVGRAAASFFKERISQLQSDPAAFHEGLAADTAAQIFHKRDGIAGIAARRIAAVGDGAGYVNAAKAMVALADDPLTDRLSDIRVPVHIIHGVEDVFCPQKAADILREAMPQASYAEIPGAGHLLAVDQPDLLALEINSTLTTLSFSGETE
ncbi:alpha/beta fold hydrolase [Paracoccus sp. MKU1]|uniref:alpha/beta fold hydrolase n=1 Tax=Paracoccus sp. MKU1 TaxID=1745182 RepID=UPI0007EF2A64|nr:alpha/beta hydrolase [Paracoccus sp. MKU1]